MKAKKHTLRLSDEERGEHAYDSKRNDVIGQRRRGGSVAAVDYPVDGGACARERGYKKRRRKASRADSATKSLRERADR